MCTLRFQRPEATSEQDEHYNDEDAYDDGDGEDDKQDDEDDDRPEEIVSVRQPNQAVILFFSL